MSVVSADQIAVLQSRTNNIRNICILAHVDHGKTTLSDYLVSSNGVISPKIAGKVRYLDSRPDEQERQITMKSSSIALVYHHRPAGAQVEEGAHAKPEDLFLINLIDSPGHIDFSSEVSNAVRFSDGALVLIDALEGVQTQTNAVLAQAWASGVRPCLVFNKIDRLITELKMTPMEAYQHLKNILETINAFASTLLTGDVMAKAGETKTKKEAAVDAEADSEEKSIDEYNVDIDDSQQLVFSPSLGNVVFASAWDCWAFRIQHFAAIISEKLKMKKSGLEKALWGEYYYNPKTQKVSTKPQGKIVKPMFVQFILENIWQVYQQVLTDQNAAEMQKIVKALNLKIPVRELSGSDWRVKLQAIFSRWLPIPNAVLGTVVEQLPSPIVAQGYRLQKFWPGIQFRLTAPPGSEPSQAQTAHGADEREVKLAEAVAACKTAGEEDVLVFVAKMIDIGEAKSTASTSNEAVSTDGSVTAEQKRNFQALRQAYVRGKNAAPKSTVVQRNDIVDDIPLDEDGSSDKHSKGKARKRRDDDEDEKKPRSGTSSHVSSPPPEPETHPEPAPAPANPEAAPEVAAPSTPSPAPPAAATPSNESGEDRFVAFARVFSGTLDCNPTSKQTLHVFGPRYNPLDPSTFSHRISVPANSLTSFLLMGREIERVPRVPAGNVCGIGGLGRYLLNVGTISTFANATPFQPMTYQSAPIVRVAIEPIRPSELQALSHGLKLLSQADPNVEIGVLETGEQVIVASGELHLERCIRDLKDRFARGIAVHVSKPLVDFRESMTVVPDEERRAREKLEEERQKRKARAEADALKRTKKTIKEEDVVKKGGAVNRKDEDSDNDDDDDDETSKKNKKKQQQAKRGHGGKRKDSDDEDGDQSDDDEDNNSDNDSDNEKDRDSGDESDDDEKKSTQGSMSVSESMSQSQQLSQSQGPGAHTGSIFSKFGQTANKCCSFRVRAAPLPEAVTRLLTAHQALLKRASLMSSFSKDTVGDQAQTAADTQPSASSAPSASGPAESDAAVENGPGSLSGPALVAKLKELAAELRKAFNATGWSTEDAERIWALGPRRFGSNVFLNRVPGLKVQTQNIVGKLAQELSEAENNPHRTLTIADVTAVDGSSAPTAPAASVAAATSAPSASAVSHPQGPVAVAHVSTDPVVGGGADSEFALTRMMENSILNGFQLACSAGPLCDEPLMGVAFILEDLSVADWDASKGADPHGPISGQVIACVKSLCQKAFLARSVRLMEAMYSIEMQCTAEMLGKLYAVLARRRGRVHSEEMKEGTPYFLVKAFLPVVESFGFATDVRKKTSGVANPQLLFSHWELIPQDPFWQPSTEEELEEFGDADRSELPNLARDLIRDIRKRKGLKVEEKTVKHGEKQRTLSKKK